MPNLELLLEYSGLENLENRRVKIKFISLYAGPPDMVTVELQVPLLMLSKPLYFTVIVLLVLVVFVVFVSFSSSVSFLLCLVCFASSVVFFLDLECLSDFVMIIVHVYISYFM